MNRPSAYYRARVGSDDPLFSGEGSQASQAKEEPQEAEKRMKAAGDLRLLRDHGHICTLPPEIRGRGSRAHAHRVANPEIRGVCSP